MSDYIIKSELMKLFVNLQDEHETNAISYQALYEVILNQPTLDETEIIRKTVERIVERLEECFERYEDVEYYARLEESEETLDSEYAHGKKDGINEAIKIIEEECGINE